MRDHEREVNGWAVEEKNGEPVPGPLLLILPDPCVGLDAERPAATVLVRSLLRLVCFLHLGFSSVFRIRCHFGGRRGSSQELLWLI